MKAVVLIKMPSQNRFLGTFDVTNLQNWWISQPLPDSVDEVINTTMIYGQYHGCLCRLRDGSYSLFRSEDYGFSWSEVYRTSEKVYKMFVPDPGRVQLYQSDGLWESYNTGLDWEHVNTYNKHFYKIINPIKNILIASTENGLKYSFNLGRTWSTGIDARGVSYYSERDDRSQPPTRYWYFGSGCFNPEAFDAAYSQTVIGIRETIFISDAICDSWNLPVTIVYPEAQDYFPWYRGKILQILHSDSWGPRIDQNRFLMRTYDVLRDRIYVYVSDDPYWEWRLVLEFPAFGGKVGNAVAYDVYRVGTVYRDKLVVLPAAAYNAKTRAWDATAYFSTDGGETWKKMPDMNQLVVYDPSTGYEMNGAVLVDSYSSMTWEGCPCHNYGYWITWYKFERAQSYDSEAYLQIPKLEQQHDISALVALRRSSELDMSTDMRSERRADSDMSTSLQTSRDVRYGAGATVMKVAEAGYDSSVRMIRLNNTLHTIRAMVRREMLKKQYLTASVLAEQEKALRFGTILVADVSDTIYRHIEELTPQAWDIRPPNKASRVVPTHAIDEIMDTYLEELK